MVTEQTLLNKSYRAFALTGGLLLAFLLTVVMVRALYAAGADTELDGGAEGGIRTIDSNGMVQVSSLVTGTQESDDALQAYIDAHILSPEEMMAMGFDSPDIAGRILFSGSLSYLPAVFRRLPDPDTPVLNVTRPNSKNDWTASWTRQIYPPGTPVVYELEEAHESNFSDAVLAYSGPDTEYAVTNHAPSTNNIYYYRVRALLAGAYAGPWSDHARIVSGYYDKFSNNRTGWSIRRTTYIEEVRTWVERMPYPGWLIMQVEDSYDWGITSPLSEAPSPPYVIEYKATIVNPSNLASHGFVFGGDWSGETCPDWSTLAGVYWHDFCFNQFYNTNIIWTGSFKLLFERIDRLVWCDHDPNCKGGGSPMKRGGDVRDTGKIPNAKPEDWNTWRIEVRDGSIKLFVNGRQYYTYRDTRYVDRPYFGFFGSTDEYSNSTWRYDYLKVYPLDN